MSVHALAAYGGNCQGSLSPGLASPAPGQMAAHWALKSNRAARDTQRALSSYHGSSSLPGSRVSYGASSHAKTPLYAGGFNSVSIRHGWKRQVSMNKIDLLSVLLLT